jgi:hypothetical protein
LFWIWEIGNNEVPNAEYGWNWFVHKLFSPNTQQQENEKLLGYVTGVDNLDDFMIWRFRFVRPKCAKTKKIAESGEESALSILAPLPVPVFLGSVAFCTHHNSFISLARSICSWRGIIAGALCLKLTTPSVNHSLFDFW